MSGQAITELRKTAWYLVISEDGEYYTDSQGNMWFSLEVIRPIARAHRVMPYKTDGRGLKQVVIGYE